FEIAAANDFTGSTADSGGYAKIRLGGLGILARVLGGHKQVIVLTHARASEIFGITARSSAMNCDLMRAAVSRTSSWFNGASVVPAAMLVTQEIPRTRIPLWRAAMTSGTVHMPTRSAPISRNE